jgi:hypothetical protein
MPISLVPLRRWAAVAAVGAAAAVAPQGAAAAVSYSTFLGGADFDAATRIAVDAAGSAHVMGWTWDSSFPATVGAFDVSHNGGSGDVFVTKLTPDGSALVYSTFIGGTGHDVGFGIAVDDFGSAYISGYTLSQDFPTTAGAFDTTHDDNYDGFAAKLTPDGSGLAYSTFLGGSEYDQGSGLTIDAAGNAYVIGYSDSPDFPTTPGAFDTSHNGGSDGFLVKLSPTGAGLTYGTLLGGGDSDSIQAVAVDGQGAAYVTGITGSPGYPTTRAAFDTTYHGADAFVTKVSASGGALDYSTILGGAEEDHGYGIDVDQFGSAYVTGFTRSSDFPTTPGAFDPTHSGGLDYEAFVTKLDPAGAAPEYSTMLGGPGEDEGDAIVVDLTGRAYVTGRTASPAFPTTPGAYDTTHNGDHDVFVTRLDAAGTKPTYSTYIGGGAVEVGGGIALDPAANAYVAGSVDSADYPTTAGAFDTTFGGVTDGFVTKLHLGEGPETPAAATRTLEAGVGRTLSLQLGPPASFGQIVPGVAKDYVTTIAATATATTDGAVLTVADESTVAPGHLVNGPAVLPSAVRARADSADGIGAPFADLGAAPLTLVSYPDQTSSDPITLTFLQPVGLRDKVRAGTYAKTLTFTLAAAIP